MIILGVLFSLIMAGYATSKAKTDVEKNLDSDKLIADDYFPSFFL